MKIDGKQIASEIFEDLTKRVGELQKKNIVPHLVVILVGDDPASAAYVHQKDLKAQLIGAKATIINLEARITNQELRELIEKLNKDPEVHGIIVQRPLPPHIDGYMINKTTAIEKDIDAFNKDSPFIMPLAAAVLKILERIFNETERDKGDKKETREDPTSVSSGSSVSFIEWLKQKNIVVVGKGETGGGPTIALLRKMGIEPKVIDSKTENAALITQEADIIVTTVGRDNVIRPENIKPGVILIGVGMHKGEDGKLHGDYEEEDIKDIASFYTPIPGGVGPVNVAMLLSNLVYSAQQ